jgi:hypothetical protein
MTPMATAAFLSLSIGVCCSAALAAPTDTPTPREAKRTCSPWLFIIPLTERFAFDLSRRSADAGDTPQLKEKIDALAAVGRVKDYQLTVPDGRVLRGRLLSAAAQPATAVILVAQGNISLADQMILRTMAITGLRADIVAVDYRGYGRSKPGIPMLAAIVEDYVDIGSDLRARMGYRRIYGYGASLGGVVLANAAKRGLKLDGLVIDSSPSDLEAYGCDQAYWPINVVASACPSVHLIYSQRDGELSSADLAPLARRVSSASCNGSATTLEVADHAFNEAEGSAGDLERVEVLGRLLRKFD